MFDMIMIRSRQFYHVKYCFFLNMSTFFPCLKDKSLNIILGDNRLFNLATISPKNGIPSKQTPVAPFTNMD